MSFKNKKGLLVTFKIFLVIIYGMWDLGGFTDFYFLHSGIFVVGKARQKMLIGL